MTHEEFNKLVDELEASRSDTLKTKNAKYAPSDDALHNFHSGADIMGMTTAQCAWGYATKHLVALRDKILRDDWDDIEDVKEKCQDLQNYITFIWCAANETRDKKNKVKTSMPTTYKYEHCTYCKKQCLIEDRGCDCCKYQYLPIEDDGSVHEEPCASCKCNFATSDPRYTTIPYNWEYEGDIDDE